MPFSKTFFVLCIWWSLSSSSHWCSDCHQEWATDDYSNGNSLAWGKNLWHCCWTGQNLIGVYANTVIMFQKKVSTFFCLFQWNLRRTSHKYLTIVFILFEMRVIVIFNLKPNITDIILTFSWFLKPFLSRNNFQFTYNCQFYLPLIYSFESTSSSNKPIMKWRSCNSRWCCVVTSVFIK